MGSIENLVKKFAVVGDDRKRHKYTITFQDLQCGKDATDQAEDLSQSWSTAVINDR